MSCILGPFADDGLIFNLREGCLLCRTSTLKLGCLVFLLVAVAAIISMHFSV